MMDEILRLYKELRVVNCGNISTRLLEQSNGDMFVAYNTLRDLYEIHSIQSFKMNGISCNTSIDEDMLNGGILASVRSSSIKRYGNDIRDNRDYMDILLDKQEGAMFKNNMERGKKLINLSLGRNI